MINRCTKSNEMAVELEFINLIIPIEKIEEYYPGGFAKYKIDNHELIGGRIWYDNFLVRDGAMGAWDIERLVNQWKAYGLKDIIEINGRKHWQDMCVAEMFGGVTLPCKWLKVNDDYASHIKDSSKRKIHRDNIMDKDDSVYNPIMWLEHLRNASKKKSGFKELRKEIYEQTIQIVKQGEYKLDDKNIALDNSKITEETVFYTKPKQLTPSASDIKTKFAVIEADCIEAADLLEKAGYNVCMLNMANRQNPGGGVMEGAGAQEENIFRRSNLLLSLYQFTNYANQYGINQNSENSYPLDRDTGGIYSKDVTIFRGSEHSGYRLLKNPFKISIVSVPAINKPKLNHVDGNFQISPELIEPSKEKIRTILRICGKNNHDALVLSAFGCGAFRNPPQHMAELFKAVFNESEFINQFKLVVFSIIDDHNAWKEHNPEGNILPFYKVFEDNLA